MRPGTVIFLLSSLLSEFLPLASVPYCHSLSTILLRIRGPCGGPVALSSILRENSSVPDLVFIYYNLLQISASFFAFCARLGSQQNNVEYASEITGTCFSFVSVQNFTEK